MPALITGSALTALRGDFARMVRDADDLIAAGDGVFKRYAERLHFWPEDKAYVCNDAFAYSDTLRRLICDDLVLAVVGAHLGPDFHVARGAMMRYLPTQSTDKDMFRWHHDMNESNVKLMILLTDIGDLDQTMSYVAGSHLPYHPIEMFEDNAYPEHQLRRSNAPVLRTTGCAGDAFFFDANGAHRGDRRSEGRTRDAMFVEFTTDKTQMWGSSSDLPKHRAFAHMAATPPRWLEETKHRETTWIRTLRHPELWT